MDSALEGIKNAIVIPIVELLFVLALFLFVWGVMRYVMNINNPSGKQEGTQHMIWGLVGMAIMISAFGILNFIWGSVHPDGTTGIQGADIEKPDVIKNQKF